jgi:hypothetical protein
MHPRHAAFASGGGGEKQRGSCMVTLGGESIGIGRADGVGRRAIDEYRLFKEGDDFRHADPQGEVDHWNIQRTCRRSIDHRRLSAGENFHDFRHGKRVGNRAGNAGGHNLAFQGPVEEILQVATQHSEHKFHPEVFQNRKIEQRFRDRRLRQQSGLDEYKKDLPAELGNVLEDFSHVTGLRHGLFLPDPRLPASADQWG